MALLFDHVINSNPKKKPGWRSKTIKSYIYAFLHEILSFAQLLCLSCNLKLTFSNPTQFSAFAWNQITSDAGIRVHCFQASIMLFPLGTKTLKSRTLRIWLIEIFVKNYFSFSFYVLVRWFTAPFFAFKMKEFLTKQHRVNEIWESLKRHFINSLKQGVICVILFQE